MRITAEAKQATRRRILEVAERLFRANGFEETTIRDVAAEVGMATGTLFNYFQSKEEVAVTLAEAAFEEAEAAFEKKRRLEATLSEDLFLQVAAQLRCLRRMRKFLQPVIETALATPARFGGGDTGRRLAENHLEAAAAVAAGHGTPPESWGNSAPVYWALYVGVLAFWTKDPSPKQEDSLAILDQSMNMIADWLEKPFDG